MPSAPKETNSDAVPRETIDTTDEALVEAAIAGDSSAFDVLATRYRKLALRVAGGIVGPDRAEDVVQDALLLAYRALASIEDRCKFSRWLCTITRYRALRCHRAERFHTRECIPVDDSVLETLSTIAFSPREAEDGDELLRAALTRIPPDYAEVIRLHFFHDLPHQKIAELLDISLSVSKYRCYRGKELLRGLLPHEPERTSRCQRPFPWSGEDLPTLLDEETDPCPDCPGSRLPKSAASSSRSRRGTRGTDSR